MGEAIPLGQAIKATKNLCTSCTETPYRDIYRDNPRVTPGRPLAGLLLTFLILSNHFTISIQRNSVKYR